MIESIFTKNSTGKPLVLKNCTFFINLNHYDIGTTYLFRSQTTYKVEEFSNEWVVDHIKGETFNKGYFSSPSYLDFMLGGNLYNPDNTISIIGYLGKSRYYVSGISIGKNTIGEKFLCKFRFLDLKMI